MEKGFSESEAVQKAIRSFGDRKQIGIGLNRSLITPFGKMMKATTWILFSVYSVVLLMNLLIFRVVERLYYGFSYRFIAQHGNDSIFNKEIFVHNTNFIPFNNISNYIVNHDKFNLDIIINNILGNIVIFLLLGIFLPLLFKKFHRFSKFMIITVYLNFSIEILQYVLKIGQFDIDDVILYQVGEMIGYIVFIRLKRVAFIRKFISQTVVD
jgi:glycopeptide antibiotics resistance protein